MNSFDILKLSNIAYMNSQIASAMIELEAMKAANSERIIQGMALAYSEKEFIALIEKYGIHHNAVVSGLNAGM